MYSPLSVSLLEINSPSGDIFTSMQVVLMFSFSKMSLWIIPLTMSLSGFIPVFFKVLSSFSRSDSTISSISNGSSPSLASGLISFIRDRFKRKSASRSHSSRNCSIISVVPLLKLLGRSSVME